LSYTGRKLQTNSNLIRRALKVGFVVKHSPAIHSVAVNCCPRSEKQSDDGFRHKFVNSAV